MLTRKNIIRLILLVGFVLLAAACGVQEPQWAGLTRTETNEIYVASGQVVIKLDASGEQVWVYPEKDDRETQFFATPTIVENRVYIGDYAGNVHAIDRETGKKVWVYAQSSGVKLLGFINFGGSTDRVIGPITPGDGILYVPNEKGIFALNQEDGSVVDSWKFETDRAIWSQPVYVPAAGDTPARVFVTSLDHYLYALDAQTGDTLWKTDLGGAAPGRPVIDEAQRVIFVATFGSEVIALDLNTGERLTEYDAAGWIWEAPVIAEGTLYFSDLSGRVYAVNYAEQRFTRIWEVTLKDERIRSAPLVTEALVIVATESGRIIGLNRESGSQEWETRIEDARTLSPLFALEHETEEGPETLLITATNKSESLVVGLRMDNGNRRWAYEYKD